MKRQEIHRIGIDAGSTTLKIVVLDGAGEVVHATYRRHEADIHRVLAAELRAIAWRFPAATFTARLTGSAGMGVAERAGLPFVQEVVAAIGVARERYPAARALLDLGGEDAKMVFLDPGAPPDIRMNGNCAGGTGAFIDQMATLMNITVEELGALAGRHEKCYPVASRCGVFAKTDVQNLLSRGVPLADLSMSILRAVAMQAVTTLARGRRVPPGVICTGGPLAFLPALREALREILQLGDGDLILPARPLHFPALGAALHDRDGERVHDLSRLASALERPRDDARDDALPPLFAGEEEHEAWRRARNVVPLERHAPPPGTDVTCFLGVDSGSTTTKIVVIDDEARLLHDYYAPNEGRPLEKLVDGLEGFYRAAREGGYTFHFASSAATGYGESLARAALSLDHGIVETMAHLAAARHVDPAVSFVLDIGGQDMKSIFARDGVISNVELNEACSSGCGSFLQHFAAAMNLSLPEFTRAACLARRPAALGSRCTVFMNSKVKQSLRENAAPGDIAAGLAYSVVQNCLFKVLKIPNLDRLGPRVVVQGGAFRNDAIYRALELLSGKIVSSTDRPELMGAFGAALHARHLHALHPRPASFTGHEPLPPRDAARPATSRCGGCGNRCTVLRFRFPNGNTCHAGNKCEKFFHDNATAPARGYNAFDAKNALLFHRESPPAPVTIGIPRVLNMYEHYPFWHALLTACGFHVHLSPESTLDLYRKGLASVMSDNICFPAKLAHGHLLALVERGVDRIFYPIVVKDEKELARSSNSYNCPVVSGYPDVLRSAIDPEATAGIPLDKPVITFHDARALERGCFAYLHSLGVSRTTFNAAFTRALEEQRRARASLVATQRAVLDKALRSGELLFVVAGRPYHADPLVHQKAGQIIADLGVHVLTDDVFRAGDGEGFEHLNIVSQWSYPNRVVQAALEVARLPANIQLVQLNSFGCGPDSFFMNETGDILRHAGKNHTLLRVDEIASPGSTRLRVRSLVESLRARAPIPPVPATPYKGYERTYTRADRRKTILAPWFADFLSPFLPAIGEVAGYRIVNLPRPSASSSSAGLKYGHNEACYPLTLVVGDIILALQSGEYDPEKVVVAITQTGGQCRATNYLAQVKAALKAAGFPGVAVLVIAAGGVYQNEQEAFTFPLVKVLGLTIRSLLYADAVRQMHDATVVRELHAGDTSRLFDRYIARGVAAARANDAGALRVHLREAVAAFNAIPAREEQPPRVGLVGEIYAKYNPRGQACMADWLRANGVEVVTPPVLDFLMQYFVNSRVNHRNGVERESLARRLARVLFHRYMAARVREVEAITRRFRYHHPPESIREQARRAAGILDLANQFGEGWTIAAEVAGFARAGIRHVVCVQPFGCIANHVVAKGIERRLKKIYPGVTLLYLDVDDGTAPVNLQNRLHFLIDERC